MHPLDDPRAKIGRAEKHLSELEGVWQKWLKTHPYLVLPYPNEDKTLWKFHVHRFDDPVKPESDIFGLIIGDYVHNLRAALDQLTWQLVTVANKISPKSDAEVAFPVVTTHPKDFWAKAMIVRQELTFEQALFIEGFQPYRAIGAESRTALANLHAVWNADKHRLVTPVVVRLAAEGPVVKLNADAGRILDKWFDTDVALEGDAKIACVKIAPVGPNPQVDVTSLPVDVAFGETEWPLSNLRVLRDLAREIVENCARFFS